MGQRDSGRQHQSGVIALPERKSGTPIAIKILVTAVISIAASALLKDYTGKDVSAEYDRYRRLLRLDVCY